MCVECWQNKSERSVYAPGKRPLRPPPRPRSDGFDIFGFDLVDDLLSLLTFDDLFDGLPFDW